MPLRAKVCFSDGIVQLLDCQNQSSYIFLYDLHISFIIYSSHECIEGTDQVAGNLSFKLQFSTPVSVEKEDYN